MLIALLCSLVSVWLALLVGKTRGIARSILSLSLYSGMVDGDVVTMKSCSTYFRSGTTPSSPSTRPSLGGPQIGCVVVVVGVNV